MEYNSFRRKTVKVKVGNVEIGGDAPISVQSMTNTDIYDVEATYRQALELQNCGCDIVRFAIPDMQAVKTIAAVKEKGLEIPIVADIHFNYKIALEAAAMGVDKIRINPGNIGSSENVREVVKACKRRGIPIRIGVNSGSVEPSLLQKYGGPSAMALAESAINHAKILENADFYDIVISVKASNVPTMIEANRILAQKTEYPLHLGVTEAGARTSAIVKSSIGIGTLLSLGIGDTVRVSLTDKPTEEIYAAEQILSAIHLGRVDKMDIVSCPTCSRTKINLIKLVEDFENAAREEGLLDFGIKVALMGCAVNGPGEAREADIGIAGGEKEGLLFKKGKIIRKIREDNLTQELIKEIKEMKGAANDRA